MDVARKCHADMRQKTERVITFMKVDDYADRAGRLAGAIALSPRCDQRGNSGKLPVVFVS